MNENRAPVPNIAPIAPAPINTRKIHFHDIEHAIVKFNGEDRTYSVNDFFRHLEQIFHQVNADDLLKFLALRNSLDGAARLLLTRGALTYDQLKASLIAEFGRNISRQEVYQTLKNRSKKPNETVRRYVMEMESISYRSDVTEFELIIFILEGLNSRVTDYALFNTAKTMNELKDAINMFEQRQAMRGGETKHEFTGVKPKEKIDQSALNGNRCFNCGRLDHLKAQCPYEERPKDICFNCWKPGHNRKTCVGPKYNQKLKKPIATVAAVVDVDENAEDETNSLSALTLVSVAFINDENKCSENITRLSLFDTGSPANLIQRKAVPFKVRNDLIETQFCGLGQTRIKTYGKIDCKITIRNRCENVVLLVVPDETLPVPMLLGRKSLEKFGISLHMINKKTLNVISNTRNKVNETTNNKQDELYFCSLDFGISERIAIASVEFLRSALLKSKEIVDLKNTEENVSTISRSPEENTDSINSFEIEIESIMAIETSPTTDELDINPELEKDVFTQIKQTIFDKYLFSKVAPIPCDFEMKIRVENDVPFHHYPKKLSFEERTALKEIIDEYLQKGIIRTSESPYTSTIVMKKKEKWYISEMR